MMAEKKAMSKTHVFGKCFFCKNESNNEKKKPRMKKTPKDSLRKFKVKTGEGTNPLGKNCPKSSWSSMEINLRPEIGSYNKSSLQVSEAIRTRFSVGTIRLHWVRMAECRDAELPNPGTAIGERIMEAIRGITHFEGGKRQARKVDSRESEHIYDN